MKYNYAVVIGRFQPPHNAHIELIRHALSLGDRVLIVLGSARKSPDVKNPFTPEVREQLIKSSFPEEKDRLIFRSVRDYPYNENYWIAEIQNIVSEEIINPGWTDKGLNRDATVCLVGHFKDKSSYYLKLFPQWIFEEFYRAESRVLSATDIRHLYFTENPKWRESLPIPVVQYLEEYSKLPIFRELKKEYEYVLKYRADSEFKGLPFRPTFVTTDAVVTCMGHILLIKRGCHPGKGLLALPGGFLAENLTLRENAVKELKEETGIKVPAIILDSSIVNSQVFDFPGRSLRGRTITHAYHFDLKASISEGLPHISKYGGDDAVGAKWYCVSEVRERQEEFMEDHYFLISSFLGF